MMRLSQFGLVLTLGLSSLLGACGGGGETGASQLAAAPELYKDTVTFKTTECAGHSPEWLVTVDASSIQYEYRYFYMRSRETYRLDLHDGTLVYTNDDEVGDDVSPVASTLKVGDEGYRRGLESIARVLDRVVSGWACWKAVPEAQVAADYVHALLGAN